MYAKNFQELLKRNVEKKNKLFALYGFEEVDFEEIYKEYTEYANILKEYVTDTVTLLHKLIKEGKKIIYMTDNVHYSIWNSINELYPNDIEYKDGVQKYLQYCADNGITKEYLDNKTGFDTPDVMKYFEGIPLYKTMEYKGYVIEADDKNLDNDNENLVHIYENQQDYINGEEIETVSLKTIGLKQNVRDYIDEFYVDKSVVESEKSYFTFVLGYDLLNDMLSKSSTPENDISYDFCSMVAVEFLKSEQYRNEKYSAYEMLEEWVIENKDKIKEEYAKFTGVSMDSKKTRELENAIVLDVGYRRNEPVALVERKSDDNKEYVIAFYYKITDNKIDWAYGYYYDNDLTKAKEDFKEVISGGNLADTFIQNKKDKER